MFRNDEDSRHLSHGNIAIGATPFLWDTRLMSLTWGYVDRRDSEGFPSRRKFDGEGPIQKAICRLSALRKVDMRLVSVSSPLPKEAPI